MPEGVTPLMSLADGKIVYHCPVCNRSIRKKPTEPVPRQCPTKYSSFARRTRCGTIYTYDGEPPIPMPQQTAKKGRVKA